jgi:chemotaxis protein MotB
MGETIMSRRLPGESRRALLVVLCVFVASATGCGLVPRSRVDECHRVAQTLRADNHRLEDVALDLRAQNQDLTQRAIDDARRIAIQDEAVDRLEKSVLGYQAEREEITRELEVLARQVRRLATRNPVTLDSRQTLDP